MDDTLDQVITDLTNTLATLTSDIETILMIVGQLQNQVASLTHPTDAAMQIATLRAAQANAEKLGAAVKAVLTGLQ